MPHPSSFSRPSALAPTSTLDTLRAGIVAGAAGGLAEVAWVTLYAGMTGGDASLLARGVTTAAGVNALLPAAPVAVGIAVHMALALALGIALAFAWRALPTRLRTFAGPLPLALVALAGVWAMNFFVVLPTVSPAFVHLVPYSVSLVSKLLFGVAAAAVLAREAVRAGRMQPIAVAGDRT